MSNLVNYSAESQVAIIELSNPPANAYSYEMFRQFDDAILRARMDSNVHVIIIRGSGEKFFCAGADIAMLQSVTPTYKYYFCMHANETLLRLENTPKLVIAAINGHCVGGGLEVAMAADLRVAKAGKSKIGLPEVALGVLPGTGGTQRLSRLLGKSKALELMIKGVTLPVSEAHNVGIINEVFDEETFWSDVMEYAKSFTPPKKASMAVGHIKRAVQSGAEIPLEAGLALERELQQRLFCSDDAKEGIKAYNEKRKPSFSGS